MPQKTRAKTQAQSQKERTPQETNKSLCLWNATQDRLQLVILLLHTIYVIPKLSMNGRIKAYVYPENADSARLLETYRETWGVL